MSSSDKAILAYSFLRDKAKSGDEFTRQDLMTATSWSESSVSTYISKQWGSYLNADGRGASIRYKASRLFLRVSQNEFLETFTQKRLVVPNYDRVKHEQLIQYEFLLPLSKEEQLRKALDDLFYVDTLQALILETGVDKLATLVPRDPGDDDVDYIKKVISKVGSYFGGYSIFHVQGRFRAAELTDITGAAEGLKKRKRYLIDETTAVVRFIAPCTSAKIYFNEDFHSIVDALRTVDEVDEEALSAEVNLIRALFFFFFVEAVVWTVKGEDEIWLIETGPTRRLYRWMSKA